MVQGHDVSYSYEILILGCWLGDILRGLGFRISGDVEEYHPNSGESDGQETGR